MKQKIPNPCKPVTLFFSHLIERGKAAQKRNDCKRKGGNTSVRREPPFSPRWKLRRVFSNAMAILHREEPERLKRRKGETADGRMRRLNGK